MLNYSGNTITCSESIDTWGCHILYGNFTLSAYYGEGSINIDVIPTLNDAPYGKVEFLIEFPSCSKSYIVDISGGTVNEFTVSPQIINFTENGQFDTIYVTSNMVGNISLDEELQQYITLSSNTIDGSGSQEIEVVSTTDESFHYLPITLTVTSNTNITYTSSVYISQRSESGTIKDQFTVTPMALSVSNYQNTFTVIVTSYLNNMMMPYSYVLSNTNDLDVVNQGLDSITIKVKNGITANTNYTITFTQSGTSATQTVNVSYKYISEVDVFGFGTSVETTSSTASLTITSTTHVGSFNIYSYKGGEKVRWNVYDYPMNYLTLYTTLDTLKVVPIGTKLPYNGVNDERIILQNKYGKQITINLSILSGLTNQTVYELYLNNNEETTRASAVSNSESVILHSCKKILDEASEIHSPITCTLKSLGYVKYNIYEYDSGWSKSTSSAIKSQTSDTEILFFDKDISLPPTPTAKYAIIPTNLPEFTADTSYWIQFIQSNTNNGVFVYVTHSKKTKYKLTNIYVTSNNLPTTTSSGTTSFTMTLNATYTHPTESGQTITLDVSTRDKIRSNASTYSDWLNGNETLNVISSVGTYVSENEGKIVWEVEPNDNSYDLLRTIQFEYDGMTIYHTLYQDNGDGGIDVPESGSGDTPIQRTEYYTFSVNTTEVDAEGANVILTATLYSIVDGVETTSDITSDVTWSCNGRVLDKGITYYVIPENESYTDTREYVFTTSYLATIPLQEGHPTSITVTQKAIEDEWGPIEIVITNNYGPDITIQQHGSISVTSMTQKSLSGLKERTLEDFDLTLGKWSVHQGLKITQIENNNRTCIVEIDTEYFAVEQIMDVSIYFEYLDYIGVCTLTAYVDLNGDEEIS